MSRFPILCALSLAAALPANAEDVKGMAITLPSGATALWQETRQDAQGDGPTYRFRFIIADLAQRVPATTGPATETEDLEDMPEDMPESGDLQADAPSVQIDGAPEDAAEDDETEAQADAMLDDPALPAAPDALMQDPIHADVVWLCQNWALPRALQGQPRVRQIVLSIADRELPFGAYDPDALQLFEAFAVPADRDICEWAPW